MLIKEVFPLLKEGVFVKILDTDNGLIYGEIIKKYNHCIYVASDKYNYCSELDNAVKKGYAGCFWFDIYSSLEIEILSELPKEHKPHKKAQIKGRVCDMLDKLKPGVFVKTRADGTSLFEHSSYIIGEIGLVAKEHFYIFTNEVGYNGGNKLTKDFANRVGYKYSWGVANKNQNLIEILDKLPEEKQEEDKEDCNEVNKCDKCSSKDQYYFKYFLLKLMNLTKL